MSTNLLEQFSTHLKQTIAQSISIAAHAGHAEVHPVHLLAALLDEDGSIGKEILFKVGIQREQMQSHLTRKNSSDTELLPGLNHASKQALEKAMLLAYRTKSRHVGTEHLLYGLVDITDPGIADILGSAKTSPEAIHDQIITILESAQSFPDMEDIAEVMERFEEDMDDSHHEHHPGLPIPQMGQFPLRSSSAKPKRQSSLEIFAINLTDPTIQKRIDPVIGREQELLRLMHIMSRRHKNNPLLIGEAGVGKTAIVEGLAKRIIEGSVPPLIRGKKIYALDLTRMIAGTIYRGEFEGRLKNLMEEVAENSDIVLFIDEIHTVIGAGSSQGTLDAANILKPALARGDLRCIGATTIDEYKKSIANDPALARRFQTIPIEEPTAEETIAILEGIKSNLEEHHNATITKAAIEAAVRLSVSFITERFLPDKAADLLDEAAAALHLTEPLSESDEQMDICKKTLADCIKEKEAAIRLEQFDLATRFKKQEERVKKIMTRVAYNQKREKRPERRQLDEQHVVRALAQMIHADPALIEKNEWERLETIEDRLGGVIIGQTEVIRQVSTALKRGIFASENHNGPKASFLFVGPSGVGKTELAKVLAKELFLNEKNLLHLNMSEFAEGFSVSKLLGSPAGYVGHKERNHFFERLAARPSSVILFDEFDKAHPDVRTLLLQILDEGTLTDSAGKKISFKHAVIILTTNMGAEFFRSAGIGFEGAGGHAPLLKEKITGHLKEEFGAPLLGRLSDTCIFTPLSPLHLQILVGRAVEHLNQSLQKSGGISIALDKTAEVRLADIPLGSELGARHIRHAVDEAIHPLLPTILKKQRRKKQYRLVSTGSGYMLV